MPAEGLSEFASLIHDLRQPLSTIETCTFLLRMMLEGNEDPRVLENLDRIERQVAEAHRILLQAKRGRAQTPGSIPLTKSDSACGA